MKKKMSAGDSVALIGYSIGMLFDLYCLSVAFSAMDSFRYQIDSGFRALVIFATILLIGAAAFDAYKISSTIFGAKKPNVTHCPSCGANVTASSAVCWRCHYPLKEKDGQVKKPETKAPQTEKHAEPTPSIQPTTTPVEDGEQIEVYLTGLADQLAKINVIRVVREVTGLGLADAKKFVENTPSLLKATTSSEEANQIKELLESAGGIVEFL